MSDLDARMMAMGRRARAAADAVRLAPAGTRSAALTAMAAALRTRAATILQANTGDIDRARTTLASLPTMTF